MKQIKRSMLLIIFAALVLLIIGLVILLKLTHPTITSYEDANGWIYECSQPIKAKNGSVAHGHPQGPIPYNQSDADKYCHKVGIE